MQRVWCWITVNSEAIAATAAFLGMVFTAAYLIATILIFRQTKKSADAATEAARAATASANLASQLNRPHMGLETAKLTGGDPFFDTSGVPQTYLYRIHWTFRNFGTVPANEVRVDAVCSIDCEARTSQIRTETESSDAEVFPGPDRLTRTTSLHLDRQQFDDFNPRGGTIQAVATVRYSAPAGVRFKHTASIRMENFGKVTFIGSKTKTEPL